MQYLYIWKYFNWKEFKKRNVVTKGENAPYEQSLLLSKSFNNNFAGNGLKIRSIMHKDKWFIIPVVLHIALRITSNQFPDMPIVTFFHVYQNKQKSWVKAKQTHFWDDILIHCGRS